ncbi:MAG: sugar phosphate nucleotidyltransferase [Oscillospiraceae bacterium]|nr:sugar phosphate nucleotidyltransferase [Oscillospiraceae bacterium]
MKAVILAGGEGTRLRPLSITRPKPMVPLFDKPVLEHSISLLRKNGITDICVTLQYRPDCITDYFGDGSAFGVSLKYFIEETPLGTAGSVKACAKFLGDDDFLVISGDAVCDFNLNACASFHQSRSADATLVLYRHETPLEYGLVLTDRQGRILQFIEKPSWGQVFTNMVNTGIYFLSPRVLDRVPADSPCDFGKDLFPSLLSSGRPLYGCAAEGYWCDIGDCAAYLTCMADILSGKTQFSPPAPQVRPGIWSHSPLPDHAQFSPPCYIGENVLIGAGSLIGPCTALGGRSSVGEHSLVQRSMLEAARVGDRATLYGAILCRGSAAQDGSILNEGAVLGEESIIGKNAIVMEKSRIWPNQEVPAGARQNGNLAAGGQKRNLQFGDGGVVRGELNLEITPELCVAFGAALGPNGPVGIGWSGGKGAANLADAVSCGVRAAGGVAAVHDGGSESAAAWVALIDSFPRSIFVNQQGNQIFLRFLGPQGLALGRAEERKMEGLLLRGEQNYAAAMSMGELLTLNGIGEQHAEEAAKAARDSFPDFKPFPVSMEGMAPDSDALLLALKKLGCHLRKREPGIPLFRSAHGGLRLSAVDERGIVLPPWRMLTLLCRIALERGDGAVAVPADATAAIELLAESLGGRVLRLGRDGKKAETLYARQIFLRDASFGAALICAQMGAKRQKLHDMAEHLPPFHTEIREIPLSGSRGSVMRKLAETEAGDESSLQGTGLRFELKGGHVYIAPLNRRSALRIIGEGETAELAQELCTLFEKKVKSADA